MVQKRSLRERKFVNYVHDRINISRSATTPSTTRTTRSTAPPPPMMTRSSSSSQSSTRGQRVPAPPKSIQKGSRLDPLPLPRMMTRSSSQSSTDNEQGGSRKLPPRAKSVRNSMGSSVQEKPPPRSSSQSSTDNEKTLRTRSKSVRNSMGSSVQEKLPPKPTEIIQTRSRAKSVADPTPKPSESQKIIDFSPISVEIPIKRRRRRGGKSKREGSESEETTDDETNFQSKRHRYSNDGSEGGGYRTLFQDLTPFETSPTPQGFDEMQCLWSCLSSEMSENRLKEYKIILIRLFTGRISSLDPIQSLIDIPNHLISIHERLFTLLTQASGAYSFKNHCGSRLISRHQLADTSQIGAQLMIECLEKGIESFDVMNGDATILKDIQTYVRIGIKDILEEAVESLPSNRRIITVDDVTESLTSRLFGD